jgi:hypothetical protein
MGQLFEESARRLRRDKEYHENMRRQALDAYIDSLAVARESDISREELQLILESIEEAWFAKASLTYGPEWLEVIEDGTDN